MNKKYVESVVNFLNNTQGDIEDYQIRFMLLEMYNLDLNETELSHLLDTGTWLKLNSAISWDDTENFIEVMNEFRKKIEKEFENEKI